MQKFSTIQLSKQLCGDKINWKITEKEMQYTSFLYQYEKLELKKIRI